LVCKAERRHLVAFFQTRIALCGNRCRPFRFRNIGSTAPVEIKLNRTKRVLAAEMGTTSETLSRTLAKFRDQKFLRVQGNTVVVTRPRELQKLLQRNLGEL